MLDVRLHSECTSGSVNYFCQKLYLKSSIGLWICPCLHWVWQFLNKISKVSYEETQKNGNKHVPFVPSNSSSKIFDFGWQIIKWAACSMTPIFVNTCISRPSEIALLYYYLFCYCNLWLHTNTSRLIDWLRAASANLFQIGKFIQ